MRARTGGQSPRRCGRQRCSALWACCQLAVEGDGLGYFGLFAVRPDRQGAGIGKAVLAEAERRAVTEWQCTALRMLVIRQRADLIAWYERLGFARTGATSPFPYRDERLAGRDGKTWSSLNCASSSREDERDRAKAARVPWRARGGAAK